MRFLSETKSKRNVKFASDWCTTRRILASIGRAPKSFHVLSLDISLLIWTLTELVTAHPQLAFNIISLCSPVCSSEPDNLISCLACSPATGSGFNGEHVTHRNSHKISQVQLFCWDNATKYGGAQGQKRLFIITLLPKPQLTLDLTVILAETSKNCVHWRQRLLRFFDLILHISS